VFVLAVLSIGCATCPVNVFLLSGKRAVNSLKNRTTLPAAADFDPRVTLDAMLTPGEDRSRWQHSRAGAIEGYIVRVHDAGVESANCLSGTRLDAHIEVALRPDAPPNERVIVEITPPMREWAASRGVDWRTGTLRRQLTGRRARIEGWLLFDNEHDEESENTRPGHRGNWRATAWEVHPVTAIVVSDPVARMLMRTAHDSHFCADEAEIAERSGLQDHHQPSRHRSAGAWREDHQCADGPQYLGSVRGHRAGFRSLNSAKSSADDS